MNANKMFPDSFITNDDLKLRCSVAHATQNAKAILIVVHGLGEHSQSLPYSFLEKYFTENGFTLVRFDLRGHGESAGLRQHIDTWDILRDDLDVLINIVRRELPQLPIFLLGASLGALIALDHSIGKAESVDGVLVLAPALSTDGASRFVRAIVPIASLVLPKATIDPGLNLQSISRDQEASADYISDPLFSTRVTIRMASEILSAVTKVRSNAERFIAPLLILHGDADEIVPVGSSRLFFEQASSIVKHRKIYPGALHNLLLETNREQVHSDILGWLNDRLGDNT